MSWNLVSWICHNVLQALQRGFYWRIVQCQLGMSSSKNNNRSGKCQHETIAIFILWLVMVAGNPHVPHEQWQCAVVMVSVCWCLSPTVSALSHKLYLVLLNHFEIQSAVLQDCRETFSSHGQWRKAPAVTHYRLKDLLSFILNSVYYYHISLSKCKTTKDRLLCSFFLCCLRLSS